MPERSYRRRQYWVGHTIDAGAGYENWRMGRKELELETEGWHRVAREAGRCRQGAGDRRKWQCGRGASAGAAV